MALSTHEAEYLTGVNTGHEVVWQHELYSKLGFVQKLGYVSSLTTPWYFVQSILLIKSPTT